MEIVFIKSSNISKVMLDRRYEDSEKRSLMNKKKRKSKKDEEDMRQKEDNGRGNGKWHDAMRSEGSYTSLFLYSG